MVVLVTGASGVIGRAAVAHCRQRGLQVRAFVRQDVALGDDVQIAHGDIRDARSVDAALRGVSHVLHLAGVAHDSRIADWQHFDVSVLGTLNLVRAAKRHGVARVVFASSLAVYAPSDDERDEAAPAVPQTAYGASRRLAESLLLGEPEIGAAVLRPAMVYGPRCKGNLPRLIHMIERRLMPPLPDTGATRVMVHVDDLAAALVLAATHHGAAGEVFHITDGQAYGTRAVCDAINRALGRVPLPVAVPHGFLRTLAKLGDVFGKFVATPLDSTNLDKLLGNARFRSDKARELLGFQPQHSLFESLPTILEAGA